MDSAATVSPAGQSDSGYRSNQTAANLELGSLLRHSTETFSKNLAELIKKIK